MMLSGVLLSTHLLFKDSHHTQENKDHLVWFSATVVDSKLSEFFSCLHVFFHELICVIKTSVRESFLLKTNKYEWLIANKDYELQQLSSQSLQNGGWWSSALRTTSFPGSLFSASLRRWNVTLGRQRRETLGTRLHYEQPGQHGQHSYDMTSFTCSEQRNLVPRVLSLLRESGKVLLKVERGPWERGCELRKTNGGLDLSAMCQTLEDWAKFEITGS